MAPTTISFDEAIAVAILGLIVNLACAWLLHDGGHHDHDQHAHAHEHAHDHRGHSPGHGHDDHTLTSAYFHVLTDELTAVLAIAGLLARRLYGLLRMNNTMGI